MFLKIPHTWLFIRNVCKNTSPVALIYSLRRLFHRSACRYLFLLLLFHALGEQNIGCVFAVHGPDLRNSHSPRPCVPRRFTLGHVLEIRSWSFGDLHTLNLQLSLPQLNKFPVILLFPLNCPLLFRFSDLFMLLGFLPNIYCP